MRRDGLPDLRALPALVAALGVAGGIVLADTTGAADPLPWIGGALVLAAASLLPLAGRVGRVLRTALLLGAAVALGGALLARHAARPPDSLARLVPTDARAPDAVVVGRVVDRPVVDVDRMRLVLAADSAGSEARRVAVSGRIQVTLGAAPWDTPMPFPPVRQGDRVRLVGRLHGLPERRNPSDFDYGRWLARQGRVATLRVYEPSAVRLRGHVDPGPILSAAAAMRSRVENALARFVPSADGRALQTALVLGDRTALEPDVEAAFRRTGLTHLLAVSGLHVLLVGMLLYGLLAGLLRRVIAHRAAVDIVRATVTIGVLVVYAVVTGGSASVVRAVVMAAVLIAGDVAQRTTPVLNSLGLAMLAILVVRPTQLFDAGFLLSFSAVAGLVVLVPVLRRPIDRRPRLRRWAERPAARPLVTATLATLAASIATLPVLLALFGRVPLGGLVLNLPAIPLTNLTFAAGLATSAVADVPALAAPLGRSADALSRLLLVLTERGDAALGALAYESVPTTRTWTLALTCAVLALGAWARRRVRTFLLSMALVATSGAVWSQALSREAVPGLDVLFFDVGQGDAALVRLPGGRTLLIDTGPSDARSDAGTRTILPHLKRMGMDRIDAVVVSHPHRDHEGGLPSLIEAGVVGRVLHNGDDFDSDVHRDVRRLAMQHGVPLRAVRAGDTLALDPAVRIDVLAPGDTLAHPAETNDASVVLRLRHGSTTWLFLGDAQLPSEARLVARYGSLLRSTVVKVGHHGSRTSSTPSLVQTVRSPDCRAVISVASQNVYRLPNAEVVARWRHACPHVHETRTDRAVWLRSDGRTVEEVAWR